MTPWSLYLPAVSSPDLLISRRKDLERASQAEAAIGTNLVIAEIARHKVRDPVAIIGGLRSIPRSDMDVSPLSAKFTLHLDADLFFDEVVHYSHGRRWLHLYAEGYHQPSIRLHEISFHLSAFGGILVSVWTRFMIFIRSWFQTIPRNTFSPLHGNFCCRIRTIAQKYRGYNRFILTNSLKATAPAYASS